MNTGTIETLESPTGAFLRVFSRRSNRDACPGPRGIVLVQHGLAEHAGRYTRFSEWLAGHGFHVYAHDHRGHGRTRADDAPPRRFARTRGPEKLLADCAAVHGYALHRDPDLPVIVFGHSMGGLVALAYAQQHGRSLAGAAIWNIGVDFGSRERLGRRALGVERALKGSDVASALMRRATFDAWAKTVEARRTPFDWLSHEADEVEAYAADPLCGFTPTISMMGDVMNLLKMASARNSLERLPPALPIHCLGGGEDPVTDGARAVTRLARRLSAAGVQGVRLDIIAGARHETLNEVAPIRRRALQAFEAWLDRTLPARAPHC